MTYFKKGKSCTPVWSVQKFNQNLIWMNIDGEKHKICLSGIDKQKYFVFFSINMHPNQVLIEVLDTPEWGATLSFFEISHVTQRSPYLVASFPKMEVDPEKLKGAFMSESHNSPIRT